MTNFGLGEKSQNGPTLNCVITRQFGKPYIHRVIPLSKYINQGYIKDISLNMNLWEAAKKILFLWPYPPPLELNGR